MSLDPINLPADQAATETGGPPLGHNLPYAVEMVPTSALSAPDRRWLSISRRVR